MIVYERSTANYTPNNHERINTPQTVKIKQLIKSLIIFNTPEEIAQNVIWLSDPKLKDKFVKLGDRVYKIAHKDMNQNFVGLTKTIYNDASCSKLSFQQNDEQKIVLTISEEANFDYYKKIYLKFLTGEDEIPQTFDLQELRKNCVLQLSEKPLVVNQTVNIFHKGKTFTLKIIRADSEEYSLLNRSTKMHFDGEIHKIIKKIQVKGPLEVTYHIKLASPSDTKPALLNCDSLKTFLNRNLQGKSLSRKLNLRVQLSEQLFALEVKEIHCKNAKLKKKHRYGVCYEALGTIIHLFKTTISEIYPIRNKITYVTEAFFKINAFLPTQERLCYIDKQEILKKLYSIKEFYSYLPVTIALNNGMVNVCLTKPNESAPFSKCILQPTTNMTFDYDRSVVKLLDDVLPRRIPKLNIEISQLDSYQVQFYREQLNQIVRENTHHIFLHDRKKEITFQNKQLSLNIKLQNFSSQNLGFVDEHTIIKLQGLKKTFSPDVLSILNNTLAGLPPQFINLAKSLNTLLGESNELRKMLECQLDSGVLFYGPQGTGKKTAAKILAKTLGEENEQYWMFSAIDLVANVSVASEKLKIFFNLPANERIRFLIITEIEHLFNFNMLSPAVHTFSLQFLRILQNFQNQIFCIGVTSNYQFLHQDLTPFHCFQQKIEFPLPDKNAREEILKIYLKTLEKNMIEEINIEKLALETATFSGSDLKELLNEAKKNAIARIVNSKGPLKILMEDFVQPLKQKDKKESPSYIA